ncbi:MAG: T9SS type A sorting domain-containing protein [Bacteroidetes bacterium]|nr:T9SS type A sorting domain-containing protein [Bacteroidota bacterium]
MKKLFTIFTFIFVMVFANTFAQSNVDKAPFQKKSLNGLTKSNSFATNKNITAMWDVVIDFAPAKTAEAGIETDGTNIYTAKWSGNMFYKYSMTGTLLDSFSIAGVTGIRDLAYDGTYFYGGSNAANIYKMNFTTHTLVSTIACPAGTTVRNIAYDPNLGGLWVGGWGTDIKCISPAGAVLGTPILAINHLLTGIYGSAYDNWSAGGPYLWLFDQTGGSVFHQISIATGLPTGVTHDASTDVTGVTTATTAGGAFCYLNGSIITLGGCAQGAKMFAYDITPAAVPTAACTPLTWAAGSVQTTSTVTSGTFTLSNTGLGTLTCTGITGVSAPFTCTLVPASVSLTGATTYTFTFSYNPTVAGVDNQTAVIATNGGNISIALSGTGIVCNTISSYPFNESFEGANFPPDCWSINDADGDTYNWESRNITGWTAHSGTGIAVSASYTTVALTPDNYLITPKLNINSPNLVLKYWVAAQDPLWAGENYSVMVSTTTNAPASFTEVFNETLTDSIYHEITVPLSAYNGQNVYVAFRHWNVTDMFYLKLDDVSIDLATGISNTDLDNNISVYPNPARNIININSTEKISNVKVMNVVGSTIYNEAVNSNNFKLNSSNYNAGIYFIQLDTKNGTITKKIQILE